jgi:hypothetical protein
MSTQVTAIQPRCAADAVTIAGVAGAEGDALEQVQQRYQLLFDGATDGWPTSMADFSTRARRRAAS